MKVHDFILLFFCKVTKKTEISAHINKFVVMKILERKYLAGFFKNVLSDTGKTLVVMFRILIPVSIAVKILQELGMIKVLGDILAPMMKLVGLPGEMGLVWASGMITNLYGGIIAYINISSEVSLSISQITVLSTMMLVAHTFPIELQVARKAGVKYFTMFLIRFIAAFLMGGTIYFIYNSLGIFNETSVVTWKPDIIQNPTLLQWGLGELKNYLVISIIIFSLIFLIKFLNEIGVIKIITKMMKPVLKLMGIGAEVSTITIIGLTLGVVYGGALIINETKNKLLDKKDVFYSLVFMGLCHSVIEDTILMMSLGADISGVLIIRLLFSILFTWILVRVCRKLPDKTLYKVFLRNADKTKKLTN